MKTRNPWTEYPLSSKTVVPVVLTVLAGIGGSQLVDQGDGVPEGISTSDQPASQVSISDPSLASADALVSPEFGPKPADTVLPVPEFGAPAASAAQPALQEAAVGPAIALRLDPPKIAPAPQPEAEQAIVVPQLPPVPQAENVPVAPAPGANAVVLAASAPIAEPAAASAAIPASPPAPEASLVTQPQIAAVVPAVAAPPAPIAEVAAPTGPALANWNFSLADLAPAQGRSAFAAAPASGRIKLAQDRQPAAARRGDAASLAAAARRPTAASRERRIAGPGFASPLHAQGKYRLVGSAIEFQLPAVANGEPIGNLTLHVGANQEMSLQLKDLLSLFEERIDPQVLATLIASPSIDSFVSFDRLREAGIDIRYDAARDRLAISAQEL